MSADVEAAIDDMLDAAVRNSRERLTLDALTLHVVTHGPIVLHGAGDSISAASEWGSEAPDSPMAGAAAYGLGNTALEALAQLLTECRCLREDTSGPPRSGEGGK